jgi:hypothetical protein
MEYDMPLKTAKQKNECSNKVKKKANYWAAWLVSTNFKQHVHTCVYLYMSINVVYKFKVCGQQKNIWNDTWVVVYRNKLIG